MLMSVKCKDQAKNIKRQEHQWDLQREMFLCTQPESSDNLECWCWFEKLKDEFFPLVPKKWKLFFGKLSTIKSAKNWLSKSNLVFFIVWVCQIKWCLCLKTFQSNMARHFSNKYKCQLSFRSIKQNIFALNF